MPKRNETLKFSTSFLGTVRASATTTIVDTSYPMTYNTRWSANANGSGTITEVNEGNDAYFIVSSDNVPDGTVLSVMLTSGPSANGITGDDIVNYQYKQNITIYNNFASLKVSIAADQVTENREEFYGMLLDSNGSNLSHAWLAINDTSKTPEPTYSMGWYSNVSATTAITSINEGSTAWLIINTTNVTNGTKMVVRINGEISESDFVDNGWERSVIIQNNIGRISYPIKADNLTEGVEKINAFLFLAVDRFTVKANAALNINDTSIATFTVDISDPGGNEYTTHSDIKDVVFASAVANGAWCYTHVLYRYGNKGNLYSLVATGSIGSFRYMAQKHALYSWNPKDLNTIESRRAFGKYYGSVRVPAPYGERLDRDYHTFLTKDMVQDSISRSMWGEMPNFNDPNCVVLWFGEGWNYQSGSRDNFFAKSLGIHATTVWGSKPGSGSRNGWVNFLAIGAFDNADINGEDAPYPRIIKAGKLTETAGVRNIYRNKTSQNLSTVDKFSLILGPGGDVSWASVTVNRYVDRFEIVNHQTNHTNYYQGFNYIVIQNYA